MAVVAGQALRALSGLTEFVICGKTYQLPRNAGSDLLRYGWTVNLQPRGKIHPERDGCFLIEVPDGVFFTYAKHLRNTVKPKGTRNQAVIYEHADVADMGGIAGELNN